MKIQLYLNICPDKAPVRIDFHNDLRRHQIDKYISENAIESYIFSRIDKKSNLSSTKHNLNLNPSLNCLLNK